MAFRSAMKCRDCNTTLILPEDPEELALAMTAFMDVHNKRQHWRFELIPVERSEPTVVVNRDE